MIQNFNPDFEISGELNMESNVLINDDNLIVKSNIDLADFILQKTHFGNVHMNLGNDEEKNVTGDLTLTNGKNRIWMEGIYNPKEDQDPIKASGEIQFRDTCPI